MNPGHIRNFSIIAHVDHGKSTLADRLLERTGTIPPRQMRDQVLDRMDLERERGITIKMTPVRMTYHLSPTTYNLNLIDTPGHIDFSYEVSRALHAVEGVLLLVDSTQGVQAQTLTVLGTAREQGIVIVPVVSKIDSPLARTQEVKEEVAKLLDIDSDEIIEVSGKTGQGVPEVLAAVIERIPAPVSDLGSGGGFRAIVFDFGYTVEDYRVSDEGRRLNDHHVSAKFPERWVLIEVKDSEENNQLTGKVTKNLKEFKKKVESV